MRRQTTRAKLSAIEPNGLDSFQQTVVQLVLQHSDVNDWQRRRRARADDGGEVFRAGAEAVFLRAAVDDGREGGAAVAI